MWLDRGVKDLLNTRPYAHTPATVAAAAAEKSPHLPLAPYSNFDASAANLEVLLRPPPLARSLQLAGTQHEAVYYKRSSACVLPLPDECAEATNWTADHACWMAYVSASNDLPVEAPVTGREESSRHHLTCECARSPPLCISLIPHFVVQTLRRRCRMPGGNQSSRSDGLEELHAASVWTAHAD